jgi:endoglucanase
MYKLSIITFFCILTYSVFAQPAPVNSETFIQVDQFGYRTNVAKVAVIRNPVVGFNATRNFTPSTGTNQYQVRRTSDNVVVKAGKVDIWNNGATDVTSGDKAWWFDFTDVTTPGEYYIYDIGKNKSSYKFKIGDNVYTDILKTAMRMFYYNRCGAAKTLANAGPNYADGASFIGARQDKNCRSIFDTSNAATEKDLSGGWWDAGDFNKYVSFARKPVNLLLTSYTKNPAIWKDDYNIPESGNGIPDILDEIKWELDWLKKMQLPDGSSLIKMGFKWGDFTGTEFPSKDTRRRYYYPGGCSGATISSASVFAHAANVFKNITPLNAYANDLQARAINAWNNFKSKITLDLKCDIVDEPGTKENGTAIQAGNANNDIDTEAKQRDIQFMAAVYLFALTGQQEYKTYVDTKYAQTVLFLNNEEEITADYLDALIKYAFLSNATTATADAIKLKLIERGQTQDYLKFTSASDSNAYRAFIPYYFYNFGSNSSRCDAGALGSKLAFYNLGSTADKNEFVKKTEEIAHYIHGANPFGKVYLSNMYLFGASNCVDQLYHDWFKDNSPWDGFGSTKGGPAPGYLVGGPNPKYRTNIYNGSPPLCAPVDANPCNQPFQKSYKDFNDENNQAIPFEVNEPAIYFQAAYIQLLSSLVTNTAPPINTGNGTGLSATYFNNKTLTGSPVYTNTEAVNFDWGNSSPNAAVNNDNFSARWEGEVEAPVNGTYGFATVSDDGVRLFVNDTLIVNNFTDHSVTTNIGNRTFVFIAGRKYKIKMEYYESLYGAVAKLLWMVPGQAQMAIPKDRLYPIANTVVVVAAQGIGSATAAMRIEVMDSQNTTGGVVQQSASYTNLSTTITNYTATFNGNIPANRIRVRFIDNANVDLRVDYLKVGNTVYPSKAASTFSIGHYNTLNGCNNSGYLLVDELYCNGYFQYNVGAAATTTNTNSLIVAKKIDDNLLEKFLKVSPNPAKENTQIYFYANKKQLVNILLKDIFDRNIPNKQYNANEGLNTYNLKLPQQSGTYFLQVIKDGKTEISKVVVVQ